MLNHITSDPRREGEIISMLLSYIWSTAEGLIKSGSNQCSRSDGHFPCPWNPRSVQKRYHRQKRVTSDTSSWRMRLTSHPPPTGISNVAGLIFKAFNQPPRAESINTLQSFVPLPSLHRTCLYTQKLFIVSCLCSLFFLSLSLSLQ